MPEKVTFFEKANVNGPETREVFSFLKQALPTSSGSTEISWNFEKFLIGRDGKPARRYEPSTSIDTADIEALLEQKA